MQIGLLHCTALGRVQLTVCQWPVLQSVGSLQLEGRAAAAGLWPAGLLSTVPVDAVAQLHLLLNILEAIMGGLPRLIDDACTTLPVCWLLQPGIQANWQEPMPITLLCTHIVCH
jgi:hypothetical protein